MRNMAFFYRFWKPFNPLLGETFEFVNNDVGYAVIAEQVSEIKNLLALQIRENTWTFNINLIYRETNT